MHPLVDYLADDENDGNVMRRLTYSRFPTAFNEQAAAANQPAMVLQPTAIELEVVNAPNSQSQEPTSWRLVTARYRFAQRFV